MPRATTPHTRSPRSWWRVGVPIVFGLAGLLLATSFQTARGTDLRAERDLPALISDANRAVQAKDTQVRTLQAEVEQLTAGQSGDTRVAGLTPTINRLAPVVGTREVSGPTITVRLDDSSRSPAQLPSSVRPDDLVVHQQDVQAVVNALWRGGAEAMMIQDQRVIATSAVRCVGNTLILQGRVYSPPFTIKAMGPTQQMGEELDRDPQVAIYRQWVDNVGLGYAVTTSRSERFPAFGTVELTSATVVR